MSERDKTLVLVMTIILILGGGYKFLIMPAQEEYKSLEEKLAKVQIEYNVIKTEVDTLPLAVEFYNEKLKELEEIKPSLDPYREEEDVERVFTQVVSQVSLDMNTVAIKSNLVEEETDQIITKDVTLAVEGSTENYIALIYNLQNMKDFVIESANISNENDELASININGVVNMHLKEVEIHEE